MGDIAEEIAQEKQTCQECGNAFKKASHYYRHMREKHSDNRDYVCKEEGCGKTFKRGSHLKRHMVSHSHEKGHPCSHCKMSFGYKHHLERHIKVVHLSQRLQCVVCRMQYKKKKAYHKHMAKVHPQQKTQKNEEDPKYESTKGGHEEEVEMSGWSEGASGIKSEKLLYRCNFEQCLSAFEHHNLLS